MILRTNKVEPNHAKPPFIKLISEEEDHYKETKGRRTYTEVFAKCRDIVSVDGFSKKYRFLVIFVKRYGRWLEYGRTETIANTSKPSFTETFTVEATNTENIQFKVRLFDGDSLNSRDLQKCQVIGSTEFELNQLDSDSFKEFSFTQEDGKSVGVLCLCTVPFQNMMECKKVVCFSVGAGRIAKRNFFNRANVYLEISRELFEDTYHAVYRSEVIIKTNTPHWKLFTINIQKLCNSNSKTNLLFQIFGHTPKGEPQLKGQVVLSLAKLMTYQKMVKEFNFQKLPSSKRSANSGFLKIYHVSLGGRYSLVDYTTGGIQLNASIAVDFTLSNGQPLTDKTSLHYLRGNQYNEYVYVMEQIGSWVMHYCKSVPLFGFGGKVHSKEFVSNNRNNYFEHSVQNTLAEPDNKNNINNNSNNDQVADSYCFQISENESNINELVSSYKTIVPVVEAGGPTFFKDVLKKMFENSIAAKDFSIFLIITDGVNNDESAFEKFLLEMRELPFITIIAGIGPCLFTSTQYLVNRVNRKVKRKLLFFIKVKITEEKGDMKELYGSVSKTIVDFFIKKNIYPEQNTNASTPLDIDFKEINYRPGSPMFKPQENCPTSDSFVNLTSDTNCDT